MFSFFKCISCNSFPTHFKSFPLCELCFNSLLDCPPLCQNCSSPLCIRDCLRPWIKNDWISSYSARYCLIGAGYTVLKSWKTKGGLIFDHKVLNADKYFWDVLKNFCAESIIPIPHSIHRIWQLKSSPTLKIAKWLSKNIRIPIHLSLGWSTQNEHLKPKPQGKLQKEERLLQVFPFDFKKSSTKKIKTIILVDDFMTTGKTLSSAAQILKLNGISRVHAFCLGYRSQLT